MKPIYYVLIALLLLLIGVIILFRHEINIFIVAVTGKKRMQKKLYKDCKKYDYLILNKLYFKLEDNRYRKIDSLIIGNKFIYVVKQIKAIGYVNISLEDKKWNINYDKQLRQVDNPLKYNEKTINEILNQVPSLERKDLKSIAMFTKTCEFDSFNHNNEAYVLKEDDVVKAIYLIEKESNEDIIDSKTAEKYAKAFYDYCTVSERELKNSGYSFKDDD